MNMFNSQTYLCEPTKNLLFIKMLFSHFGLMDSIGKVPTIGIFHNYVEFHFGGCINLLEFYHVRVIEGF